MQKVMLRLVIATGLSLVLSPILADSFQRPDARVFASKLGSFGFKSVPVENADHDFEHSHGMLFTLNASGKEHVLWETRLLNVPHRALVSDHGKYVVTLDTGLGAIATGTKHCLVIYGRKGKVIADFQLGDLLTEEEIAQHAPPATKGDTRWFFREARFEFDYDNDQLVITFEWGKTLRISLSKGTVKTHETGN